MLSRSAFLLWMAVVGQSTTLSQTEILLTTVENIAVKFDADINCAKRVNTNAFSYPLTFPLEAPGA